MIVCGTRGPVRGRAHRLEQIAPAISSKTFYLFPHHSHLAPRAVELQPEARPLVQ